MGFDLASITAAGVSATIGGIGGLAKDIREAIVGKEIDPTVTAQIELKLAEMETQLMLAQVSINMKEAESEVWWKAGWRCFIGWTCGFSLMYSSILRDLMDWLAMMCGYAGKFPVIDTTLTTQIVIALLGLGSLRSFDKKQAPSPAGKE